MPDLNIAKSINKDDYAKHEGEVHVKDGVQYKVINEKQDEYIPQKSKKSTNLFEGTPNAYFEKLSGNKAYQNKDGSPKSAQQINMFTGVNKIHPDKFKEYDKYVGYKPKQEIVFTDGGNNRETETITQDIPEDNGGGSSTSEVPDGGGGSFTYTVSDGDSNKEKKRSFKNIFNKKDKIKGDGLTECSSDNPTACGLDMAKEVGKEKKAETKAYNQAQRNRSYRVKKDGTQVLKKQFAPGEWFNEKMDNFKDKRIKNQAKKDQNQRQREIKKESNRRRKLKQIEFQHEHSDRYGKVDNFFNELAYKKRNKKDNPGRTRTIKASF